VRSVADSAYDLLGWVYPVMGFSQDGMKFSTPAFDNDPYTGLNCAAVLGGSFWYARCAIWLPTAIEPSWLISRGDSTWKVATNVHMMVKLQWISSLTATEDIYQTHASPVEFCKPTSLHVDLRLRNVTKFADVLDFTCFRMITYFLGHCPMHVRQTRE